MTTQATPLSHLSLRNPRHLLALGFGAGLMPKAPGTWGSLAAMPIGVLLLHFMQPTAFFLFSLCCFVIGGKICGQTAKDMGVHDHGAIVWDEFVGIFFTLLALPTLNFFWLCVAFLAFRVFDITKPYPIRYFDEKWHTGFGIMIDDLLAAGYAIVVIMGIRYWIG